MSQSVAQLSIVELSSRIAVKIAFSDAMRGFG